MFIFQEIMRLQIELKNLKAGFQNCGGRICRQKKENVHMSIINNGK